MYLSAPISQLTIRTCHLTRYYPWHINYIQSISSLTKITCLCIKIEYFSIEIFAQFLHLLPDLDTLTIIFMCSNRITKLTEEQMNIIRSASSTNRITKINIEQMNEFNQIDVLIEFCPRVEYLRVKCRNYIDLEVILHLILMKRKSNIYLLCFCMSEVDESTVARIQTMIHLEKLLANYKIQYLHNKIYLQWQKHELNYQ